MHIIHISQADLTAENVVRRYKPLTDVERAFRCPVPNSWCGSRLDPRHSRYLFPGST